MTLDAEDVARRLSFALRSAGGAALPAASPAAEAKARAVAQYAALIADAYADGALSDAEMAAEIDEIAHMTRRFARTLRGATGAAVERAAREALRVLFGALRAGLSFAGAPLSEPLSRRATAMSA